MELRKPAELTKRSPFSITGTQFSVFAHAAAHYVPVPRAIVYHKRSRPRTAAPLKSVSDSTQR